MKLTVVRCLLSFLICFTGWGISFGQTPGGVNVPSSFSNSVVIMIPEDTSVVDLLGNTTKVTLYVVEIDSGKPRSIVLNNALKSGYKKYKAEVHVRGDATALDPKQQFAVKLHHDKKEKGNFLGMKNAGKEWVFNDCGAVDQTLMRNVITFTAQNKLGQYAPQWKWFELFICDSSAKITNMSQLLNNYYWGLYLNFDKIMFEPGRVFLPGMKGLSKDTLPYTYSLIQLNQAEPAKYYHLPVGGGEPISLTAGVQVYEPKKKDLEKYNSTDSALIINTINNWYYCSSGETDTTNWGGKMNNYYLNYLLTPSSDTTGKTKALKKIRKITDYNSFATYFLINELCKDPDGYHKSTFMVKGKNVCYAGPLWDKNKSYGNLFNNPDTTFFYNLPSGWLFHDSTNTVNGNQCPVWWYVLLSDSVFCKTVWGMWKKQYQPSNGALNYNSFHQLIKSQVTFISKPYVSGSDTTSALIRNIQRWPNAYSNSISTYNIQVKQLDAYLRKRFVWMNTNLPGLLQKSGCKSCK